MDSNKCSTCLFGDKCPEPQSDCYFYFPIDELSEDEILDEKIDEEYIRFCEEWIIYTNEDGE